MIKQISKVTLVLIIFLSITYSSVLAYSDDLFKFDLPSSYGNLSYNNMYVFADTENENRGMMIYTYEDKGLKKSVWDIEESDLNTITRYLGVGSNVIKKDKKAKLGKEKAVNIVMEEDNEYVDIYILASNKYIYMVVFIGNSQAELSNEDYETIKESFKLKDRTTNPTIIYILIVAAGIGIRCFIKFKKQNKINRKNPINNEIDYKNMTEEDFKKLDEL